MSFVPVVLSAIFLATLLNIIAKKISLPTILGYIFTGLILINLFNFQSQDKELLAQVSEFGIVFLMFTIGLEFSINVLVSMKKEVFLYGFLQLLTTSALFTLSSFYIFNIPLKGSIIIGSALSLSSTAIVIKMLNDTGDLQRQYGRKALGILLFQDLAVIVLLLMITIFTSGQNSLYTLFGKTIYGALVVGVIIYIIGKYILNYLLTLVTSLKSYEIFISTLLFIIIGSSYMAHYFGFSYSLGAFLAGMMISETKFKYQIEADMIPFRDILLGIFFVSVGMQIDIDFFKNNIFMIVGITIVIMVLKAILLYIVLSLFTQKRTALKTALSLSQVGEFAIVLIGLAASFGLIENDIMQILLIATILSMIIAPFIIKNIRFLADIINTNETEEQLQTFNSATIKNHIVVCGYGRVGKIVSKKLLARGLDFIVVEHDIKLVKEAIGEGILAIFGNAAMPNILKELNLKDAICAIVAIENEEKLYIVCKAFREYNKELNIVVNVKDAKTKDLLEESVNHILFEPDNIANMLIDEATTCQQKAKVE